MSRTSDKSRDFSEEIEEPEDSASEDEEDDDGDGDEDEEEHAEDTPDLYRHSALGM
jgi:hypothetical protein